ncbi:MAG TPA: TetR/AcrR family transcriptional regulator [Acidimicrobiales bacterium]|nr:TetR/AcrR family transcriptional regulator [Acidimicrobiales bacterium]
MSQVSDRQKGALAGHVLDFPAVAAGLPPVPPGALDPFLDAAAVCFARFGVAHTTVPDIARELGVSRMTVYRRLGSVPDALRTLLARELHRLVVHLADELKGAPPSPETIVELTEVVVRHAGSHPVLRKALADEPELVGPVLLDSFSGIVDNVTAVAAPMLAAAMDAGLVRRQDPGVLTDWLVRTTVSVIASPPRQDLRSFLTQVLLPLLTPTGRT